MQFIAVVPILYCIKKDDLINLHRSRVALIVDYAHLLMVFYLPVLMHVKAVRDGLVILISIVMAKLLQLVAVVGKLALVELSFPSPHPRLIISAFRTQI